MNARTDAGLPRSGKEGHQKDRCLKDVPCGLHIIGTERHEARRIDRQLRGRCGRQGDPGSSRFFLSLEDDLLRIFGASASPTSWTASAWRKTEPIEHKLITRAIENAQGRVEGHNFDIRKHLLEYDDVMNKQREIIYELRNRALHDETLEDLVTEYTEDFAAALVDTFYTKDIHPDDMDVRGFKEAVFRQFSIPLWQPAEEIRKLTGDDAEQLILDEAKKLYLKKAEEFAPEMMRQLEKWIYLRVLR